MFQLYCEIWNTFSELIISVNLFKYDSSMRETVHFPDVPLSRHDKNYFYCGYLWNSSIWWTLELAFFKRNIKGASWVSNRTGGLWNGSMCSVMVLATWNSQCFLLIDFWQVQLFQTYIYIWIRPAILIRLYPLLTYTLLTSYNEKTNECYFCKHRTISLFEIQKLGLQINFYNYHYTGVKGGIRIMQQGVWG